MERYVLHFLIRTRELTIGSVLNSSRISSALSGHPNALSPDALSDVSLLGVRRTLIGCNISLPLNQLASGTLEQRFAVGASAPHLPMAPSRGEIIFYEQVPAPAGNTMARRR